MTPRPPQFCIAALATLGLVAGCSGGSAPTKEASNSAGEPASAGASAGAQVPSVWVLDAPSGYQTQGPAGPGEAGRWKDLLTAADGCILSARGDLAEEPAEDMRSASVELLQSVADADDAEADPVQDRTLVSSGAGEGNEPKSTVTFVSADWSSNSAAVRALTRVQNLQNFDGSKSSESLTIRFTCRGDTIDESAWDAVTEDIRPVVHSDSPEGEPWAARLATRGAS